MRQLSLNLRISFLKLVIDPSSNSSKRAWLRFKNTIKESRILAEKSRNWSKKLPLITTLMRSSKRLNFVLKRSLSSLELCLTKRLSCTLSCLPIQFNLSTKMMRLFKLRKKRWNYALISILVAWKSNRRPNLLMSCSKVWMKRRSFTNNWKLILPLLIKELKSLRLLFRRLKKN